MKPHVFPNSRAWEQMPQTEGPRLSRRKKLSSGFPDQTGEEASDWGGDQGTRSEGPGDLSSLRSGTPMSSRGPGRRPAGWAGRGASVLSPMMEPVWKEGVAKLRALEVNCKSY